MPYLCTVWFGSYVCRPTQACDIGEDFSRDRRVGEKDAVGDSLFYSWNQEPDGA